jgi:hypothetical protein
MAPAALILFIPFALVGHALAISGLRAALGKKPRWREEDVEERLHESERPQ